MESNGASSRVAGTNRKLVASTTTEMSATKIRKRMFLRRPEGGAYFFLMPDMLLVTFCGGIDTVSLLVCLPSDLA
jgi:hypothetical protein